jgi:hypothetical protein
MLYGNHDIEKKLKPRLLDTYSGPASKRERPLCPGLTVCEGVRLAYTPTGREIFIVHGHQADFFNDRLWRWRGFFSRYIWRPLELDRLQRPRKARQKTTR